MFGLHRYVGVPNADPTAVPLTSNTLTKRIYPDG